MLRHVLAVFALLAGIGLTSRAVGAGEEAKARPVAKVITLLKDMRTQLEKEAEDDEDVYKELTCWCKTNDEAKTKSIAAAEASINKHTTTIETGSQKSAELETQIATLKKEVAANQEALDEAVALRKKELAAFTADEKDMTETLKALDAALVVLSKHNSFIQLQHRRSLAAGLLEPLRRALGGHHAAAYLKSKKLTAQQRNSLLTLIQQPEDYFDAAPTFKQSYAPQSGEIYGILQQMKETFEKDLTDAQKDELKNQKEFDGIKAEKEVQIAAGQDQIETKSSELADTTLAVAQAKTDLEDTKASLTADEKFLLMLKEKCQMTDQEWEERSKTRADEIAAVSKALEILSSDDAHAAFSSTFSLLQEVTSSTRDRRVQAASQSLVSKAHELHSPRLAAMAYRVRLDSFTRVKKAIDDMVAMLLKEKDDEIKLKDYCISQTNKNEADQTANKRSQDKSEAKIADLTQRIESLASEIETLHEEVAQLRVEMKDAGDLRAKENAEFQKTVADNQDSQAALGQAITVLKGFYAKASLLQQRQPAGPPPPAGFETYRRNSGGNMVIDLLEQITRDSKAQVTEATRDETDAQQAYEAFVQESQDTIKAKLAEARGRNESKATAETDLVEQTEDQSQLVAEGEQLVNLRADLRAQCDFTINNFDIRQEARDQEIEALRQAKAILSGAKF